MPSDEHPRPRGDGALDYLGERRAPPSAIVARVLLVVLLVAAPVVLGSVAADLFAVRASLQDARSALREVRGSIGSVDVEAASTALQVANDEVEDAESRAGRFTWSIASYVPFAGPSIDVTREVVDVASAAVAIATVAVDDGQALLDDGLDVRVVDGRVDLAALLDAREVVGSLPVERLASARAALGTPRDAWLPEVIQDGRAETMQLASETLTTVVRAQAVTDALPTFLGTDGPRRYFVGLQTSAELRGTGGLIGYWGVLGVDGGQVAFGQSAVHDPSTIAEEAAAAPDAIGTMGLSYTDPPDADPAFLARYATLSAARSFPNVNLDPDLPTTAKAILDLYEMRNGDRLDGVILLDPQGLQGMLEAAGSTLPLGPDLAAAFELGDGLPTDRFAQFVTADIYATYGADFGDERDAALQQIGDAALATIFAGRWDSTAMLRAVATAASEKHLQLFSADEHVQAAFREVGAAGVLAPSLEGDVLAITANNAVGGKQDVHLGHEFALDVQLGDVRRADSAGLTASRTSTARVTVDNPLPTTGMDDYVIGSCYVPGGFARCFDGEAGTNRTWFSLWTRLDNPIVRFDSDDATYPARFDKTFRDLRVVDYFHLTPSRQRRSFEFETDGRTPLRLTADSLVYELTWWRQAKATPDLLDITVHPPEGWVVDRVEVTGGGAGRGSGVHGAGQELVTGVVDGRASVTGTVTGDLRLQVHLVGPDVD